MISLSALRDDASPLTLRPDFEDILPTDRAKDNWHWAQGFELLWAGIPVQGPRMPLTVGLSRSAMQPNAFLQKLMKND